MHTEIQNRLDQPIPVEDVVKFSKMVQGGYLNPVLNEDTWTNFISELKATSSQLILFRVRKICRSKLDIRIITSRWQRDVDTLIGIEWIDLRCECKNPVIELLRKYSIPFSIEKSALRVWVFVRTGIQPEWAY